MKEQAIEKLSTLTTSAFGLVAALAWNEAIKSLFKSPCGLETSGSLCYLASGGVWVYAIIVTIIAVVTTVWIGIVSDRVKGNNNARTKKVSKAK